MNHLIKYNFFGNSFIEDGSDSLISSFINKIGIHQLFVSKYRSSKFFIIFKYDSNHKLLSNEERTHLVDFLDTTKGRLLQRIVPINMYTYHVKINTNSRANSVKYIKKFYGRKNVISGTDYMIDESGITFPFTYLQIPYHKFKDLFFLIYSLKNSSIKLDLTNRAIRLAIKAFINDSELEEINNYLTNSQLVNLLHHFFASNFFNTNSLYNNRSNANNIKFLNDQLLGLFDITHFAKNNETDELNQLLNSITFENEETGKRTRGGKKIKKIQKIKK